MNIALCRLKELNIWQDIKDIKNAIGVAKTARKLDDKYYLPDRENFFHFLTKCQSFAKLLVRIIMCARESHRLFLELLHRSAFIETISLFTAVLAEIWTICIEMCRNTVQFYNGFYPFYAKNYDQSKAMPKRLDKWLGEEYNEYIDISVDSNQINSNEELYLFDGSNGDTVERDGMIVEQQFQPKLLVSHPVAKVSKTDEIDAKSGHKKSKVKMIQTHDLLETRKNYGNSVKAVEVKDKPVMSMKALPIASTSFDLGEKISRTNEKTVDQNIVAAKTVKHFNVDQLKTIKEIREFLSVEDELRQNQQEKTTKGIKNNDWEKFKADTNNLLILSHHGLVLKKFRNQWKNLLHRRRYDVDGKKYHDSY